MDFKKLVEQTLNESPDEIGYNGKGYRYDEIEGNPHTFFITSISVRKDFKKGYKSDVPSNLGMCIVHCPTVMGNDVIDEAYLEDPENKNWTHFNFSSLLIYNKAYSLDDLRKFGFEVFSFKKDANSYFDKLRLSYPRLAFTLTKDNDEIALKFRGRFWKIGKKFVVSLWFFDKNVVQRYLIPFFKQRYGVGEDDIIFETYRDDKDQEDARMVPGSKIVGVEKVAKPYEKEIAQLLSQLHVASGDESKKNQIKNKLFDIFAKHGLNPATYGFKEEEVEKGSLKTARKIAGPEPMAKVRSLERTSESLS